MSVPFLRSPNSQSRLSGLLLVLVLLIGSQSTFGQEGSHHDLQFRPYYDFDRLGCGKGSEIQGYLQDSRGYLWCFNRSTLFRYDGIEAVEYRHDPADSTSIGPAGINSLYEDRDGFIWIGFYYGPKEIDRFDPSTGIAEHITSMSPADSMRQMTHAEYDVTTFQEDRQGNIWFGTWGGGIGKIDRETLEITRFHHDPEDPNSLSGEYIGSGPNYMFLDSQGDLWINAWGNHGATRRGISRLDPRTLTFHRYDSRNGLSDNRVWAMFEDHTGQIWARASGDRLHSFNRESDSFVGLSDEAQAGHPFRCPRLIGSSSGVECYNPFRDRSGIFWLSSRGAGLNRYDPETGRLDHFENDPTDPLSLPDNNTAAPIWETHDGLLWISMGEQMYTVDTRGVWWDNYEYDPNDNWSADRRETKAFQEDQSGNIYVGGLSKGFGRLDRGTGRITWLPNTRGTFMNTWDIHETTAGEILVATWCGYCRVPSYSNVWRLNRDRQLLEPVFDADSTYFVRAIYDDPSGELWLGAQGRWSNPYVGGVIRLSADGSTTRWYDGGDGESSELGSWYITKFYRDRGGVLWACGSNGLHRYRPKSDSFETVVATQHNVTSVLEDSKGRFWFSVNPGGLILLDRETLDQTLFGKADGLPSIRIGGLLEDDVGDIWMGTDRGISRFDPENLQFRNFDVGDGLLSTEYNFGDIQNYHKASDGTLFFGGRVGGFTAIHPDRIQDNPVAPMVVLEGISLNDRPLQPSEKGPLRQPLWRTDELVFKHDQNNLTFAYAGMHYVDPTRVTYAYMLEGLDDDWVMAGTQRSARYAELRPNRYTFRVKAANSDGVWDNEGASILAIIVRPPWWRTTWAYTAYGILFVVLLALSFQQQRKRIERIERERVRERELAQAKEIETAYGELELAHTDLKNTQQQLVQTEKMASLGQLASGIAHEMQNPLNFVKNFALASSDLIEDISAEAGEHPELLVSAFTDDLSTLKGNVSRIARHSDRAESIVKSMMAHAQLGSHERYEVGVNNFVEEYIGIAYHAMKTRLPDLEVDITRNFDPRAGNLRIAPQEVGRALVNIVNNALESAFDRYEANPSVDTEKNGAWITIGTKRLSDRMEVRIADNGTGIPEGDRSKVFEPFFTTKPAGSGTGLGLSLAYEIIVDGHGGTLTFESEEGQGTTFVVGLPTGGRAE